MLTKNDNSNGTNVLKNQEFDISDWAASYMVSYHKIRERMDSFHLIGRTIKDLKAIGHSYWHTRDGIESAAYSALKEKGLSEEELQKASNYKNIDEQLLFPRSMYIDEPFLLAFEDGDQFEIETIVEPRYCISMNAIPWDFVNKFNDANADAAIIFSPCIGEKIERIEYDTELMPTEDDEELEIVDDLIIWLSNGMGLSISTVWYDYCCVELIDANKELEKMKFSELKTALFKWEEFEKEDVFLNERVAVPKAVSIRPLAPVLTERFAILVYYENGETKKYVLPISDHDESKETIEYKGHQLTNEIWNSAQLDEHQNGISYIQLKSGYCISTTKCYELGTTYSEPVKQEKIIYENEKFAIKTLWNWDVQSLYGDKELGVLIAHKRKDKVNDMDISTLVSMEGKRITSLDFTYLSDAGKGALGVGIVDKGYGLMNVSGEFVIPPIYNGIKYFDNGMVRVRKGDTWFFIDSNGNEIDIKNSLIGQYEDVGEYAEGMCAVSTMKLSFMDLAYHSDDEEVAGIWGFINEKGEEVIHPQYIYAYPFNKGVALVCKGEWTRAPKWNNEYNKGKYWTDEELWGGINKAGEPVIPFIFDAILEMEVETDQQPVFMAHYGGWDDGHWGVIDAKGDWLADPVFEDIDFVYHDGLFAFYPEDKWEEPPMGVYDTKTQKVIFEPQFEDIYFLDNGLIRVEVLDETLGHTIVKIIDREGKEKFHSEYDSIYGALMSPYWETSIMEDGERKRGLIDDEGNVVVPCLYEDISGSKELLSKKKFIFQQGKKKGICRFDGTVEIQPIYDEISDCNHDMYIIRGESVDGSYGCGLITDTGEEVLPTIYNRLSWFSEDILILSDENGCTVAQYIEKK